MIVAQRFLISGRVQGVGFRYFADEVARREGLSGFVRNRADGRVEVVVEGEQESVARFEMAMRQGPPLSRIDAVDIESLPPAGRRTEFVIRG